MVGSAHPPSSPSGPDLSFDDLYLPGDLWIEIAVDLDPLDAIALSETCRALHSLLTGKSIWIRILRSIIWRLGPFIPAYSIPAMNVQELQHAAAGPLLWQRIVETKSIPHAELPSAKRLHPKLLRELDILPLKGDVHLVPGGRFMLSLNIQHGTVGVQHGDAAEFKATIVLWDLGTPGDISFAQIARVADHEVVSEVLEPTQGLQCAMDVSVIGESSLRIAVTYLRPSSQRTQIVILGISLDTDDKTFVELGSTDVSSVGQIHVRIQDEQVLLSYPEGYHLWNYGTRHFISWSFNQLSDEFEGADRTIVLMDRYVIEMTSSAIQVWDVSRLELLPLSAARSTGHCNLRPHAFLTPSWFMYAQPHEISTFRLPSSALPSTLLFDLFYSTWKGGIHGRAVIRFELSVNSSESGGCHLTLTPVSTGHFPSGLFFPNGELSTPMCLEFGNSRTNLHEPPFYAYSPADQSFLPNRRRQALGEAADGSPLKLVPLIQAFPRAACAFSGRVVCQPGMDMREGQPMLCADYLPCLA